MGSYSDKILQARTENRQRERGMMMKMQRRRTIGALIELGETKGQLSTKEIQVATSGLNLDPEQMKKVYDTLKFVGIEIVEKTENPSDLASFMAQIKKCAMKDDAPPAVEDPMAKYQDALEQATVLTEEEAKELTEMLQQMTPREQKVLCLRFGLADGQPHTWEEVADRLNVTRERIHQIEVKALRKCRPILQHHMKMKDFMD